MKAAVAHLEPHIEKTDDQGKGTIVLATVKGDVHDIGKNLVDIILSNNGYDVVNIGIKQPISEILRAAEDANADVIGMSGLLVKSTVVMRENLEEINSRGTAAQWPVILGGAALTRAYVENDLADLYDGEVRYARDAFEGLRLMDALVAVKRGVPGAELPALRPRRVRQRDVALLPDDGGADDGPRISDVERGLPVPTPPFWGERVVKGIQLADYASYLDERATFVGQWGLKGARSGQGPSYEELVETEGRPRLRMWLERVKTEGLLEAAVVYGFYPCVSEGDDLVAAAPRGRRHGRRPRHRPDALHLPPAAPRPPALPRGLLPVPRGGAAARRPRRHRVPARDDGPAGRRGDRGAVREERLPRLPGAARAVRAAHRGPRRGVARPGPLRPRVRREDDADLAAILRQGYRGSRYSFGYPACPDLEDRAKLVELLKPERIGVELSEELQLHPEQSTDALVVHHPEAKYFNAT